MKAASLWVSVRGEGECYHSCARLVWIQHRTSGEKTRLAWLLTPDARAPAAVNNSSSHTGVVCPENQYACVCVCFSVCPSYFSSLHPRIWRTNIERIKSRNPLILAGWSLVCFAVISNACPPPLLTPAPFGTGPYPCPSCCRGEEGLGSGGVFMSSLWAHLLLETPRPAERGTLCGVHKAKSGRGDLPAYLYFLGGEKKFCTVAAATKTPGGLFFPSPSLKEL